MVYFDSRDTRCKSPAGARPSGSVVEFKLYISDALEVDYVNLKLRGKGVLTFKLLKSDEFLGDKRAYYGRVTVPAPGLYRYRFELVHPDGSMHFCGTVDGFSAVVADWLDEWYFTAFMPSFSTPVMPGAVMYQIFPDRFFRCGVPPECEGRVVHQSWKERPQSFYDTPGYKANDFFGGSIEGITKKLDYIKGLGVTHIYLNPIFESAENHRYSTGDYHKVDRFLGSSADFNKLCKAAQARGMRVILDGVFSHTGADSLYFNKYSHYNSIGAYNSKNSEYYSWYSFKNWPDEYESWWGFKSLPNTRELEPGFLKFITGPGGVLEYWQRLGAGGWRFDVADELPDEFIERARARIKAVDPGALFIGEVWENAVKKESMGHRRRYLLGGQFDSVMNYPWQKAIIALVRDRESEQFMRAVDEIVNDYPEKAVNALMNPLSTHDTVRIINALGCENIPSRQKQPHSFLSHGQYEQGKALLHQAAAVQYMLPGMPSIFYGDECGLCGFDDPYCRATMPWDNMDSDIYKLYEGLGKIRTDFCENFISPIKFDPQSYGCISFRRGRLKLVLNLSLAEVKVKNPILGYRVTDNKVLSGGFAIEYAK